LHILVLRAEKDRYRPVGDAEVVRRKINSALKSIKKDVLARYHHEGDNLPQFAEAQARYAAAVAAADKTWKDEVAKRPIDDAAWEEELEWRRQIDARPTRIKV
jgi:hypothetical protein